MSNYTKLLVKKPTMKRVDESIELSLSFNETFIIKITSYDTNYFPSGNYLISRYWVILDYIEFCDANNKIMDFIDFIQYSIQIQCGSDNMLFKKEFSISNDKIYFTIINEDYYINKGKFYINNYKCNVCNSHIFIENTTTGFQYIYIGM